MAAERIKVRDPETDTDRVFNVKPLTRSVAEALDELDAQQLEVAARVLDGLDLAGEGESPSVEQRAAVIEYNRRSGEVRDEQVRITTEMIDVLTEPAGERTAGGLLLSRWRDDDLTEAELDAILTDAQKKATKRPR